jgi:hypothetical protein
VQRKPEAIATSPVHVTERRTRATERSSPRAPMTAPNGASGARQRTSVDAQIDRSERPG